MEPLLAMQHGTVVALQHGTVVAMQHGTVVRNAQSLENEHVVRAAVKYFKPVML